MLASLLLTASLWPASVTKNCVPLDNSIIVGVAKKPNGDFLYCELISQPTEHSLQISYRRDTKEFAEKTLLFPISTTMPSVSQKDFRSGEFRQADVTNKDIKLQYQPSAHKKMSSESIPRNEVDVVDAGFDGFIRNNWGELQSGKTIALNFASIAHLKVLPLRVSKQPPAKCAIKTDSQDQLSCFLVEIDNALLRLLLGNIKLTYDQQHRLVGFYGVVNIEDDNESTQTAAISYYYQEDNATK